MNIESTQKELLELVRIFDKVCYENNLWYVLTSGSLLGAIRHQGFIPWDPDFDVFIQLKDRDEIRKLLKANLPPNMKLYIWDQEENYAHCQDRLAFVRLSHDKIHIDIHTLIGAPKGIKEQKKFVNVCFYSYKLLRCKHINIKATRKKNRIPISIIKIFMQLVPDSVIRRWYYYLENKYPYVDCKYLYTIASGYGMSECLRKEIYLNTVRTRFESLKLPIPNRYDEYLTSVYGDYMTPKKEKYKKF